MNTQDKYPNANTSPERLAEIENAFLSTEKYHRNDPMIFSQNEIMPLLRDLLAMLHERNEPPYGMTDFLARAHTIIAQYMKDKEADEVLTELMGPLKSAVNALSLRCAQAEIQLHDQRWRRMAEQWPMEGQQIQFGYWNGQSKTEEYGTERFCRADYSDGVGIYWRPIPPLPKE